MKRAVFLDRDGVLNPMVERNGRWGAPLTLDTFVLYPWTAESVTRLKAAGLLCLVATNQPELATGELDVEALEAMHRRLVREAAIDGIYVCPHRDADGCACRKPQPGLLEQAALEWGVDPEVIGAAVAAFSPLPHRSTLIGEIDGVRYIDDSKATNPHATLSALRGLERVVLIAGGRAKGLDLSALAEQADRLVGVVAMGEAAGELEGLFSGRVRFATAPWIEEAVETAADWAGPGDTVLLSPACSSLDQYASYAERGDRFAAAVGRLEQAGVR